jgi:hypothetical protein
MGQNLNHLGIYGGAMNTNFGLYNKLEKKRKPIIFKNNKFVKARFFFKNP